ncbi:FAD-dependent monooxygenase [Paenibacillus sp. TRM 82003]|nr:FAD-dependent monooxygenase [Paenibacillus sp. TRM 82003]
MKAIVIGAGIGGLSVAVALRAVGVDVVVYEREPTVRHGGAGLGVGANALQAFGKLGLDDAVLRAGRTLEEVRFQSAEGAPLHRVATPASAGRTRRPEQIALERNELMKLLLQATEDAGVSVRTGMKLESVRTGTGGAAATFEDGTTAEGDVLVGADGLRSAVRRAFLPSVAPKYAGYTCWRAVVRVDPDALRLDPTRFLETWGSRGRFGIVPLPDDRVYWFACVNGPAGDPALRRVTASDLAARFASYHEPIPALLRATPDEYVLHRDIYRLPPLPRFAFGRVALLGDAAHAMTPNLGQGAGQSVEDAVILADCVRRTVDVEEALLVYDRERRLRTRAIAWMSDAVGRVAQWERRLPVALRNTLFPYVPGQLTTAQTKLLYRVKLPELRPRA